MKARTSRTRAPLSIESMEARTVMTGGLPSAGAGGLVATYSIDGTGNNLANPTWGSTGTDLLRIAPAAYSDGTSSPAGADRPSAREISNVLADQGGEDVISDRYLSAMFYAWGQFIDHDLDLTRNGASGESFPVEVPAGDPSFDPAGTGTQTIPLSRSDFDPATGTTTPREQVNSITAWLDGSMIYGSDAATAAALRTFQGGALKTSAGGLLPLNDAQTFPGGTLEMDNAGPVPDDQLFAAGDVRANENAELTSLQTLFVREHNSWASRIASSNPSLTDEQVYQRARSIVIGEIQSITYNQWLPTLLGKGAIDAYSGYDPGVNPGIANEFATAAFRFGHSLLGDDVEFLDDSGLPVADEIPLSQAFFNPGLLGDVGIDPLLKYLASDPASELDNQVVDSVRNFLFGPPGSGGLDLASLNIQRGRDHGLADYNTTRQAYGLPAAASFADITSDPEVQGKLAELYGSVDDVDLWVGLLAEDHAPGASVGSTVRAIISDQFERIRDGDRFWYQNAFSGSMLRQIQGTTLSDIIERNTGLTDLQDNAFVFRSGISGTVFADANRDGRLNSNERGLANQAIEVVDANSGEVVGTATTDARGAYSFGVLDGLRTGQYQVRLAQTGSADQATPASRTVAVTGGDQFLKGVNLAVATTPSRPTPRPGGPMGLPKGPGNGNGHAAAPSQGQPPRSEPRGPSGSALAGRLAPTPRVADAQPVGGSRSDRPADAGSRAVTQAVANAVAAPLSRQLFDRVRQDLARQVRGVLTDDQFRAFSTGLSRVDDGGRPASARLS